MNSLDDDDDDVKPKPALNFFRKYIRGQSQYGLSLLRNSI